MLKHIWILQVEQTYDSEQLLQPARDIIQKLKKYLKAALKKPVYLHAFILDPRIKMFSLASMQNILLSMASILAWFVRALLLLQAATAHEAVPMTTEEAGEEVDDFEDSIYAKRQKITNVDGEIVKYLEEDLADRDVDHLGYLHRRQVDFPSLGEMARALLAIPATSVPSERAFSMGGLICRDERASLNGKTIEMLMCMQDWYKKLPRVVM